MSPSAKEEIVSKETMVCECESFHCKKEVKVPVAKAEEIRKNDYVVISHDCHMGSSTTDQFIEEGDGYSIFYDEA